MSVDTTSSREALATVLTLERLLTGMSQCVSLQEGWTVKLFLAEAARMHLPLATGLTDI